MTKFRNLKNHSSRGILTFVNYRVDIWVDQIEVRYSDRRVDALDCIMGNPGQHGGKFKSLYGSEIQSKIYFT